MKKTKVFPNPVLTSRLSQRHLWSVQSRETCQPSSGIYKVLVLLHHQLCQRHLIAYEIKLVLVRVRLPLYAGYRYIYNSHVRHKQNWIEIGCDYPSMKSESWFQMGRGNLEGTLLIGSIFGLRNS